MDSPQLRRIPSVAPLNFNNAPAPAPNNPVSLTFELIFDSLLNNSNIKAQYHHLPINLQQQLAALPPLRPLRGHAPAPAPAPPPVSVSFPCNI